MVKVNAITMTSSSTTDLFHTPLLPTADQPTTTVIVAGAVDYKRRPALCCKHGLWRSACFIIVVEMAERIAYNGTSSNLTTFLTGKLGQSTATAAANVNAWTGVACLLPIFGALIADSLLGKYCTIIAASFLYILGLCLLTVSTMTPSDCANHENHECSSNLQTVTFFVALYMVAAAQGGQKPCVLARG